MKPVATSLVLVTALLTLSGTPAQAQLTPGHWVGAPPGTAGSAPIDCSRLERPPPLQSGDRFFLLVYWSGPDTPIAEAAASCSAVAYWGKRSGQWVGFSSDASHASDMWDVWHGEAYLVAMRIP